MSTGMYEGAIQDLIDALGRLPGIGPKSAQRIAFHILQSDSEMAASLVEAVRTVKERVKFCTQCGNVSEETECRICRDPRRDGTKILCC
jgi:recombination protein RecR